MVKLEGNSKGCRFAYCFIFSPDEKRIVKDAAIHIDDAIDFMVDKTGCANGSCDQVVLDLYMFLLPVEFFAGNLN